jgi:hypothetical protein
MAIERAVSLKKGKGQKLKRLKLGREIKISPRSEAVIIPDGKKVDYFDDTVEVLIGIGKHHTASLIMDIDAFHALNAGEPIHISKVKAQ